MEIGGPGGERGEGEEEEEGGVRGGGGLCGELEDPFRDKLPLYLSGRIKDAFSRTAF